MEDDGSLIVNGIRVEQSVLGTDTVHRCSRAHCMAACCSGGVWLKDEEAPRIREWTAAVQACLPGDRHDDSSWFESNGRELGTTTVDDPSRPGQSCCVFLRPDRKCALQVVSDQHRLGWPGLKPYYCAIFPLYYEDGVLMIDDSTAFDFAPCRPEGPKVPRICELYRDEAVLILGEDGYRELIEKVDAGGAPRRTAPEELPGAHQGWAPPGAGLAGGIPPFSES